jgi:hypothetical protein
MIEKTISDNEAVIIPSNSFFTSFTAPVQYSDATATGKSITRKVRYEEAIEAVEPLSDYLEKNFTTLCDELPQDMSKVAIERLWSICITILTNIIVPQLFGPHKNKPLNIRQISMVKKVSEILRDLFHGDGGEFGLSFQTIESKIYKEYLGLMEFYEKEEEEVKQEYEGMLKKGSENELLLRLIRLRFVGTDEWIEKKLLLRREYFLT